jgi:hypothetical protein
VWRTAARSDRTRERGVLLRARTAGGRSQHADDHCGGGHQHRPNSRATGEIAVAKALTPGAAVARKSYKQD